MLQFEWDSDKETSNVRKHKVSFTEAATVLGDQLSLTFYDPDHSTDEERYITIGLSKLGHILLVAHTDREDTIRIISARKATKSETNYYQRNE